MNSRRSFHHRFLGKRQGLTGVLGGLAGGNPMPGPVGQVTTTAATTPQNTGNPSGLGGLISLFSSPPTIIPPPSTSTSNTLAAHPSSGSTGSTTNSASAVQTASSTSASPTISTTSAVPISTLTPTPSASDTVYASSEGTRIIYITSTLPTASATGAHTSFLHNPSLEGGIIALASIVFIAIVFIVMWIIRKRRRDRLEKDLAIAVTFDPGATDHYESQEDGIEKHRLSPSSSSHGYSYNRYGMQPTYAPQQEYHSSMGYGHPVTTYSAPSPNPTTYQASSPPIAQPAGQGGANLTRKFSDRKPVPPLLPDPIYDPTNTHVSIPPQYYPQ